MSPRVVILGTGTGIGKTHVTECLRAARPSAIALKPVESGYSATDPRSDQRRLGARAPAPYLLQRAVSPHLAARAAGVRISESVVCDWVLAQSSAHAGASGTLIETAGGAFSPLHEAADNTSLARSLDPDAVILVGPDRLGVLHDIRATLLALRSHAPGLPRPILALCQSGEPDASTGTNLGELLLLELGSRGVLFPRAQPDAPSSTKPAALLWEWIDAMVRG